MKHKWLAILVAFVLVAGCSRPAPTPEPSPDPAPGGGNPVVTDPPKPDPPPAANYPDGELVTHTLEQLPAPVRAWAQHFTNTTVGAAMKYEGRIWFVASIEEGTIGLESAQITSSTLNVIVTTAGTGSAAYASIGGVEERPVEFHWKAEPGDPQRKYTASVLPQLYNWHDLPLTNLTGAAVLIQPQAEQTVTGPITIAGFARYLFEGNLVARLVDPSGQQVAIQHTTAAVCCFDWGSFQMTLNHTAPAGSYKLQLGDHSAGTGEWITRLEIPIKIQ